MLSLRDTSFLVVDDSPAMRRLVAGFLWAFGAREVRDAADGADGFESFRRVPSDVVITDLAMAPTDGLALTRALRGDPRSPNPFVPILMISSHGEAEVRTVARGAGVDEYMMKPVLPGPFYASLTSTLVHRRPLVDEPAYRGPERRLSAVEDSDARHRPNRRRDLSGKLR
jgi:CheY-like chemotaxis protein